jgi:anti-sigma factor RsiW
MPNEPTQPGRPSAEQLAAYADGELNAGAARAVEEWLAVHPEDRAEVDTQRRLARLWQTTQAPDPGAGAWATLRGRIDTGLAAARDGKARPRPWSVRLFLGLALPLVGAASIFLALLLNPQGPNPVPPNGAPSGPVRPFPVASAEDVEIISINAADLSALVVGQPPVTRPLVLASAGDVTIHAAGDDVEIIRPQENPEGPSAPWIWAPRDPAGKEP